MTTKAATIEARIRAVVSALRASGETVGAVTVAADGAVTVQARSDTAPQEPASMKMT